MAVDFEDNQVENLSVVIAVVSDTTDHSYDLSHLEGCLDALLNQANPPPMEMIVPYPAQVKAINILKQKYPQVNFLEVKDLKTYTGQGGSREHHDELRARGLAAATGQIVGLLEDHARPDKYWSWNLIQAYSKGPAAVGGAIENSIDRTINWAVYFSDFYKYQNPVPVGETINASDANVSYRRDCLEKIRPIWEQVFHEPEVNWNLFKQGGRLILSPEVIVYQHRKNLNFRSALSERYIWGRSYAVARCKSLGILKRIGFSLLSPALPVILVARIATTTLRRGRHTARLIRSLPIILILSIGWSLGELSGYLAKP